MNTCLNCGKQFLPPFGRRSDYCCDECRKEAKRRNQRARQKKYYERQKRLNSIMIPVGRQKQKQSDKTLDEVVREIEEYNTLHNTRYSYGKWQTLKFFGKV